MIRAPLAPDTRRQRVAAAGEPLPGVSPPLSTSRNHWVNICDGERATGESYVCLDD